MKLYIGFLAGIVLKEKVIHVLKKAIVKTVGIYHIFHKPKSKQETSNKKTYLVCKITDPELFDEYFLNTMMY